MIIIIIIIITYLPPWLERKEFDPKAPLKVWPNFSEHIGGNKNHEEEIKPKPVSGEFRSSLGVTRFPHYKGGNTQTDGAFSSRYTGTTFNLHHYSTNYWWHFNWTGDCSDHVWPLGGAKSPLCDRLLSHQKQCRSFCVLLQFSPGWCCLL